MPDAAEVPSVLTDELIDAINNIGTATLAF